MLYERVIKEGNGNKKDAIGVKITYKYDLWSILLFITKLIFVAYKIWILTVVLGKLVKYNKWQLISILEPQLVAQITYESTFSNRFGNLDLNYV